MVYTWSPDSTKINCSQLVTLTDYIIWLLDMGRNEMVQVTPSSEEKSRNIVGPWLPDRQGFYVITDLKREYTGLAFYDIIKSKLEWILTPEHDIGSVDLSKDGKILVWTENVDGYSNIYTKNMDLNVANFASIFQWESTVGGGSPLPKSITRFLYFIAGLVLGFVV